MNGTEQHPSSEHSKIIKDHLLLKARRLVAHSLTNQNGSSPLSVASDVATNESSPLPLLPDDLLAQHLSLSRQLSSVLFRSKSDAVQVERLLRDFSSVIGTSDVAVKPLEESLKTAALTRENATLKQELAETRARMNQLESECETLSNKPLMAARIAEDKEASELLVKSLQTALEQVQLQAQRRERDLLEERVVLADELKKFQLLLSEQYVDQNGKT